MAVLPPPGRLLSDPAALYLDLLEQVLTRAAFLDEEVRDVTLSGWRQRVVNQLTARGYRVVKPVDQTLRHNGRDWPPTAETMIGLARMQNLRTCVETVLADKFPGTSSRLGSGAEERASSSAPSLLRTA